MGSLVAEALVAVTGLFPDGPITKTDGRLAASIPDEWRSRIRKWLDATKSAKFKMPPRADHEKIFDDLTEGIAEPWNLVTLLADPDLAQAYLEQLADVREQLRSRWPVLRRDTPRGERLIMPGRVERGLALSLLAVVDDPDRMLDEIECGTLAAAQVEIFGAAYPKLADMLNAIVGEEIDRKPKAWEMPWPKERIYRLLLGMPLGSAMAKVEPAPPRVASPEIKVAFKAAESLRTKGQELAER